MALRNLREERAANEAAIENYSHRLWRDSELKATDYIVALMDFTPHQDWLTYRTELRDWPSTDTFPGTKPVKPDQPTPTGY